MEENKIDYEEGTRARTSLIEGSSPDRVQSPGDNPFAPVQIIDTNAEYVPYLRIHEFIGHTQTEVH